MLLPEYRTISGQPIDPLKTFYTLTLERDLLTHDN